MAWVVDPIVNPQEVKAYYEVLVATESFIEKSILTGIRLKILGISVIIIYEYFDK